MKKLKNVLLAGGVLDLQVRWWKRHRLYKHVNLAPVLNCVCSRLGIISAIGDSCCDGFLSLRIDLLIKLAVSLHQTRAHEHRSSFASF